jgi:hypothetical protein
VTFWGGGGVGVGWGWGGGEVVMVTKKRKSFKVIYFKNLNISNIKANIFPSLFSQKNGFFENFFLEISWDEGWGRVGMKHEGPLGLN